MDKGCFQSWTEKHLLGMAVNGETHDWSTSWEKVTVEWLSPKMDGYLSPSKTQILAQKRGRKTRRWRGCHAKPSSRHGMAVGIMNTLQLCIPILGRVSIISSWMREERTQHHTPSWSYWQLASAGKGCFLQWCSHWSVVHTTVNKPTLTQQPCRNPASSQFSF